MSFPWDGVWCLLRAMKVDLGIWGLLRRLILFLIVLAAMLGVVIWYLPTIQRNERMRRDNLLLGEQYEKELQRYHQLKAANDAQKDPRTVERLVRERLYYAKPGETVIRFQPPTTNRPAASGPVAPSK
jgi:cell division protein FtsB